MKVLFIGDIVGSIGRDMVEDYLYKIKKDNDIDFVIANGENISHGKGMLEKHYDFLKQQGVDCITMGNHTYDKKQILDYINDHEDIIVPFNRPKVLPGVSSSLFKVNGVSIRVTSLLGSVYMDNRNSNPFDEIDDYLNKECDIHIIDAHCEATSEKICLAYYAKDKASALLGTHTHVQTADERVIDGKIAFISDVGMTGSYLSSLGSDLDCTIKRMQGYVQPLEMATTSGQFAGVVMEFDDCNYQPLSIHRILINDDNPYK
ncbi:MAG: TIGR00282 family metallophosphoesterase [Thomasclavelia sp.]|jgi:metallophosphoesterase (TIGR00282 family)|nr:TIGR00282 family metallophosphoesterase [Thomasclavelia sp.]